jgi:4-hydroxy-tetrahydrodipicolinate synthase
VKEASGDINQMGDIIHTAKARAAAEGRSFTVLSGDDGFTLPLAALGGDGVISVISNLLPRKVAELTRASLEGDFALARKLHYELLPFAKTAFIETNPIPIKAVMNWAGLPAGPTRLPLGTLDPKNEASLRASLEGLGVTLK